MNNSLAQDAPQIDFVTLDLLPYGVIVVNQGGTVIFYNAREEQIAGRQKSDVIGKNFFTEVAPCTQVGEFYGRFSETMESVGGIANFHFRFPFPDRPREVEISLTSFENKGDLLCMISVSDVTEQELIREQLVRSDRLREVGEAAAGVAHNFNNILTVIRGNAELLQMNVKDEKAQRFVATIMRASDDAAQMIKRIRESAQQQPDETVLSQSVELNGIIKDSLVFTEDYLRMAGDERGVRVRVETELAKDALMVRANAGALREVFVNLVRNAIDAIEGEGSVRLTTRVEGNRNFVEISDTGAGMSAEVQGKLFRPLFTTKGERGTGLGLSTCYAILRRHNGDIKVSSAEGVGTTFVVSLPAGK